MPGEPLIDEHTVARFRADLERLTGQAPTPAQPLGIAVSGGADSLALLLLAHAAYPGSVIAATMDHGLRADARAEAEAVAALCRGQDVPHVILHPDSAPTGNLQDWARAARYRALGRWAAASGAAFLATAHQRDDVAESFLMRAARGGGVRSLAAMADTRALGEGAVLLVRPLLGWSRAELAGLVAAAGIEPAADPSNANDRFDRARIRRLLATAPDLPAQGLARAAHHLRDAEEALEWAVQREAAARLDEREDGIWLDAGGLPFELQRRLALRAIEGVRQSAALLGPWRPGAVAELVHGLIAGRGGTIAEVQARAVKGRWHFRLAPPRRSG